jgi:hypothetical protein
VQVTKSKRRRGHRSNTTSSTTNITSDETVLEPGDDVEDITPAEREIMNGADEFVDGSGADGAESTTEGAADSIDAAKAAHDEAAVNSVHVQAIEVARSLGITMTDKERDIALGLFPKVNFVNLVCQSLRAELNNSKVSGLARRVHDSPTLQDKFDRLVVASDLVGQKSALTRRVPTRWNSDFACLSSHVYFESPVKALTGDERNGLKDYELTKDQWALAKELEGVLEVGFLLFEFLAHTHCSDRSLINLLSYFHKQKSR